MNDLVHTCGAPNIDCYLYGIIKIIFFSGKLEIIFKFKKKFTKNS